MRQGEPGREGGARTMLDWTILDMYLASFTFSCERTRQCDPERPTGVSFSGSPQMKTLVTLAACLRCFDLQRERERRRRRKRPGTATLGGVRTPHPLHERGLLPLQLLLLEEAVVVINVPAPPLPGTPGGQEETPPAPPPPRLPGSKPLSSSLGRLCGAAAHTGSRGGGVL